MKHILLMMSLFLVTLSASAEGLNAASQEALDHTKEILTNKQKRIKAVNKDNASKTAHIKAAALAGSEKNLDQMYNVSADIMQELVQKSGGDVEKMKALIIEAQKNPKAFYESLNGSNKALIRKLANDIEEFKAPKPAPKPQE